MATDPAVAPAGLLLVAAAKRHRSAVAQVLTSVGLHVGQDFLLRELAGSEGMSQRELADRLGVEQATVAVALRRLEAAGFVSRQPAPEDARVRLTLLTKDGREALMHIDRAWSEAEKVLTDALSPHELQQFRTLLDKVSRR